MRGCPLPGLVLTKYISSRQIIIFWNTYKKDIWCQLDLSDEYLKFKRKWCIEFTYLKLLFCYKKNDKNVNVARASFYRCRAYELICGGLIQSFSVIHKNLYQPGTGYTQCIYRKDQSEFKQCYLDLQAQRWH